MSPKTVLYVAAISLAVTVAYEKTKSGGGLPRPKIGN